MDILEKYYQKFKEYDRGEKEYEKCNYDFLSENLPRFYSSEKSLEEIYYFRAYTFAKHFKKISSGEYVITEFLTDVPWATQTEGAISCPVGHHLNEARWFKRADEYVKQYVNFWLNHIEDLLCYNNWFCYALFEYAEYTDNFEFLRGSLDKLIEYFTLFEKRNRAECGLYKGVDNYDGMELSISSYGLRPTINSYVYANAYGLYRLLEKFKDERADYYKNFAAALKDRINDELFVKDFFYNRPLNPGEKIDRFFPEFSNPAPDRNAKELIGYVPFYFDVPTKDKYDCLKYLKDEKIFKQKYGYSTADKSNPLFNFKFEHACLWNGPVWPYATSQTLKALANALNSPAENLPVTNADYAEALITYAKSQHIVISGVKRPWIDEDLDGDTGEWFARKFLSTSGREDYLRGKDYNHSCFIDHVINELCGVTVKDGKVKFEPLLSPLVKSFSLVGVKVKNEVYDVDYDGVNFTAERKS